MVGALSLPCVPFPYCLFVPCFANYNDWRSAVEPLSLVSRSTNGWVGMLAMTVFNHSDEIALRQLLNLFFLCTEDGIEKLAAYYHCFRALSIKIKPLCDNHSIACAEGQSHVSWALSPHFAFLLLQRNSFVVVMDPCRCCYFALVLLWRLFFVVETCLEFYGDGSGILSRRLRNIMKTSPDFFEHDIRICWCNYSGLTLSLPDFVLDRICWLDTSSATFKYFLKKTSPEDGIQRHVAE